MEQHAGQAATASEAERAQAEPTTVGASLDLRFEDSFETFVSRLADLGLSHVEVRPGYLQTHPDAPSAERVRRVADERDLTVSVHAPHLDVNPANLDEGLRQATADRLRETLDWAAAAGARAVVTHAGSTRTRYPERVRERARAQAVTTLRGAARHAVEVGIPLCVENQRDKPGYHRFSATPDRLEALLEDVGVESPALAVTLDVGHAKATGVPYEAFVDRFGDRIRVAHLHDNDGIEDAHDPLPDFRDVAADIGAEFNVLEMKSHADIRQSVGAG